jgi:large subunit ribosomal protein L3
MTTKMKRTGILAKKLGMTRIFNEQGNHVPVTLLKVENNIVVNVKTEEKDGYNALQLGIGTKKAKRVSKAVRGYYAKQKTEPKEVLKEFRVSKDCLLQQGDEILPSHFLVGQKVDISGNTVGRGFAGVMKRHNFSGLEASHGVSVSHRSHGSTGQRQDPGRVFKGKKMAGHMGAVRTTISNLKIMIVDDAQGLIAVEGAVPGFDDAVVEIKDAVKKALPKDAPKPAKIKQKSEVVQPKEGEAA